MTRITERQDREEFREELDSLWRLALPPIIWALHFVVSYGAAALICAKFSDAPQMIVAMRVGVVALAVIALAVIGWMGRRAWRQWDVMRDREWENDAAHGEDRHQFLGHAAFLLTLISVIGVIYATLPALLIGGCT